MLWTTTARRRRAIILYALAGGTTAYCVYKLYQSERLRALQRRWNSTWQSLGHMLDLIDTLGKLSVPVNSLLASTAAMPPGQHGMMDSVLQAAASERGQTVLSLAISVGARSLVDAVAEQMRHAQQDGAQASTSMQRPPQEWLDVFLGALSTPNGMHVMSVALSVCTTRAVDTWVRAAEDVDVWDELLRAMSKPAHRRVVHEMTEICTRTAASTLVEGLAGGGGGGGVYGGRGERYVVGSTQHHACLTLLRSINTHFVSSSSQHACWANTSR